MSIDKHIKLVNLGLNLAILLVKVALVAAQSFDMLEATQYLVYVVVSLDLNIEFSTLEHGHVWVSYELVELFDLGLIESVCEIEVHLMVHVLQKLILDEQ